MILFILLLGIAPIPADADLPEWDYALLEVTLNQQSQGEKLIIIDYMNDDVLLRSSDFELLDLKAPLPDTVLREGEKYISLDSLSPELSYRIDSEALSLEITVSPELLGTHVIDMLSIPELSEGEDLSSLYFNYNVRHTATKTWGSHSLYGGNEIGFRSGDYLFSSTGFWGFRPGSGVQGTWLGTSVTRDFRDSMRSLVIGDFQAGGNGLTGFRPMTGLSFRKNFEQDPFFQPYSMPGITGAVSTPSEVEIYSNGSMIRRLNVSPGEFSLVNLPLSALGAGTYDVIIRDYMGREVSLTQDYYFSNRLFRKGVHQYSYDVGYERLRYGQASFQYGRPSLSAFHKYGVSDTLNLGYVAQLKYGSLNGGLISAFEVPKLGTIELSGLYRGSDLENRWGGAVEYEYRNKYFAVQAKGRFNPLGYLPSEYQELLEGKRSDLSGRFTVRLGKLGTVGIQHLTSHGDSLSGRQTTVSYHKNFNRNATLSVSYTASQGRIAEWDGGGRLTATIHFSRASHSANVGYSHSEEGTSNQSVSIIRNSGKITGNDYRFGVDHTRGDQDGNLYLDSQFEHRGEKGIVSAEVQRFNGSTQTRLSASGSLVFTGKSILVSRPVSGSYAVVRTGGLEGVGISYNNNYMGETNEDGEVLIPDLLPYQPNRISLDPETIPFERRIHALSKSVAPAYRQGVRVELGVPTFTALWGRCVVQTEDGETTPLEFGRLSVDVKGERREVPVGTNGEFYLEGLTAGSYQLRVQFKGNEYEAELLVPEQFEAFTEVGEVIFREE